MRTPTPAQQKVLRDTVIFLVGVAGAIHQIFLTRQHDPVLIGFVALLLGLPWWLQRDERSNRNG